MSSLVLAIDVGTHAARAALVDTDGGSLLFSHSVSTQLQRIGQSQVEQDPAEILAATQTAVRGVMARAVIDGLTPARAALATQRSTVLAWNRHSGDALSPALSWQDTRASEQLKHLHQHSGDIKQRSGLVLSPHYGASKLHWLLVHAQQPWQPDEVCLSPLVSYLLFHLLRENPCVCDESNAGRTQLWNLEQRIWDSRLCELFAVSQAFLPALMPVQAAYGTLAGFDIPLTAVCGDQNAAFYAFADPRGKRALVNAGSGAFVLAAYTGDTAAADNLLVSLYRSDSESADRLIEGTVNGAGTALDWLYRQSASGNFTAQAFYEALPAWLAQVTQPPLFLNSIGGLGSPWWRPGPAPAFYATAAEQAVGLPEKAAAVMESIVFLLCTNIRLMQPLQPALQELLVTGGLAQLDEFCQKLANMSGLPVLRPGELEATVVGVAGLAMSSRPAASLPDCHLFRPVKDEFLHKRFEAFLARLDA